MEKCKKNRSLRKRENSFKLQYIKDPAYCKVKIQMEKVRRKKTSTQNSADLFASCKYHKVSSTAGAKSYIHVNVYTNVFGAT